MSDIICHFSPKGGIDDRISQVLTGYSKEDIGALRGLYDMDHKKPLVVILEGSDETKMFSGEDVLAAANELMKYKNSQAERHLKEMKRTTNHMANTFNQLYHVDGWNATTRRNRINMVAAEFTAEVSRRLKEAEAEGVSLTREQVINGYKSNGQFQHGQFSIFESVFDKLMARFNNARKLLAKAETLSQEKLDSLKEEDKQKIRNAKLIAQEYPKILSNWSALATFARMSLRDTESLKLGQNLEYASPTSPDNFTMDSPMEDYYNLEESVREAWMVHQSETSAFGSLGSEIRRFLSTINQVDGNGQTVKDDLGYAIKMDPITSHQYLAEILRGVTSESAMIKKLRSLSDDPMVNAILTALAKASQADLSKSIDDTNRPKNPVILTQLLLDMHKNMIPYSALVRNKVGKIIAKILNKEANSLEDEFVLRMQINQQLDKGSSIYSEKGTVDWEKLAQWNVESSLLLPSPNKEEKESKNIFASQQFYRTGFYGNTFNKIQRREYLKRASQSLGIPMTDKAAYKILGNKALLSAYTKALQEFRTETRNAFRGDVLDKLKVLETFWKTEHPTMEQKAEYREALADLNNRNIKFNGKGDTFLGKTYGGNQQRSKGAGMDRVIKMLGILASVTNNLKTERRVPWFDRKGKTNSRYSDRTPSYMGDLVDKLHEFVAEGDAQGLKDFIMDKWGQSSFFYDKSTGKFLNKWLQELYDSITKDSKVNNDAMAKVFKFDEFLGSNIDKTVSIFENFTEKQHAEAMLKQFLQERDNNKKSTLAKYPCFILGDSGAQMFFTAHHYSKAEILEGLKDVAKQERERIKYVKATNEVLEKGGFKKIDNFSQTANEFTMLKFLNSDFENGKYWKILTGNQDMTDAEMKALDKSKAVQQALESFENQSLEEALNVYMQDALDKFNKKLASVGILTEVKGEGGVISYKDTKGYFNQNLDLYGNNIEEMLEDFFWNTKYATIEQLQLFTVDPAFYDHRYPVKDLQKRYKEIYAPGKGISLEARDYKGNLYVNRPFEKAVYFDDISVSSEDVNPAFWNMLKETFKGQPEVLNAYKKNSLTDGQGYRSLKSYRAVMGMAGQWTPAMESAYNRIMDIRNSGQPITEEDIRELAQLATIFQPIKPYMFTLEKLQINDDGDTALIPVQHKYAEVVLIPELMLDGKLKDVAQWMEDNDVDLVASTKCVKVGAFGSVDLKGVDTADAIQGTLNRAFIHNLSWADYRIQSGVPEHLNHAQLFGTQIRKLILANINKKDDYQRYLKNIFRQTTDDPLGLKVALPGMGNVHLNGRNLISFYNCLIMANLFDSYDDFANNAATNQELSDKMIQNITSNANQAEDNAFGLSLIDEGDNAGDFVVPPGEPGMEHDAAALLWSLFKKAVNKQKIKGGSAVQASPWGLAETKASDFISGKRATECGDLFEVVSPEGDNVLYDEIEMPFNLSYTAPGRNGKRGKTVPLRFEDWCNTDGTLKLSDQIVYGEDAREYLSWPVSGRDKFGKAIDPEQGYYIPLIETKYKGILDIIAYRIPTERDYSMINCKVFRFSNPLAGGTMKVPSSRTTTAGFDFDIDKLYFFMREFAQTHLSKKQINDIWNAIYGLKFDKGGEIIGGNEIYQALKQAKALDIEGQKRLGSIASLFKDNMSGIGDLNSQRDVESELYDYWESAGLEGTPEEAFTKYLENHRKEYPIFDVYDPTVSPLNPVKNNKGEVVTKGNSRAARNNMLIDLMRQRLMDKETLKARYTPGGFESNRDAALRMRVLQFADKASITTDGKIDWSKVDSYVQEIKDKKRKDPEPEYDPSDPTAVLVYNQQNQVAAKLIGIFANQNTNHVYASTMHELKLATPLYFGNHTKEGLEDMLHAPEGIDVDTNVAEYLAASVDAVKDPVLNFLNLNLVTADAGALLARIGYTPQEIGLLFNQPIIKELCDYASNNNVGTDMAISQMMSKYGGKDFAFDKNFLYDKSSTTTDKLADNIIEARNFTENGSKMSDAFKRTQLHVLWLFNELMADTTDLNSFVQCTRFTAANSVGSTWGDLIAQEDRVKRFIDKYQKEDDADEENEENKNRKNQKRLVFQLFDPEDKSNRSVHVEKANLGTTNKGILNIGEDVLSLTPEEYMSQMSRNPLAFEQCMMDLTRKAAEQLFSRHFPYSTKLYKNMRDTMNHLTKYGVLDADVINSLHREFIVYLLSKQKGSIFDGEALSGFEIEDIPVTNREYYTTLFPNILQVLKSEKLLANHPFFDALTITGDGESMENLKITVQGMGGLQTNASNILTEMWAEAYNSDDVVHSAMLNMDFSIKDLAQGMYLYNFYKLGYNFHPTSTMSLAPTLMKLGLRVNTDTREEGYIDFINDVIKGNVTMGADDMISFAKQYILNHLDNKKIVFTPVGNARNALSGAYNTTTNSWNDSFTISYEQLPKNVRSLFTLSDSRLKGTLKAFRPVIAIERDGVTVYYMADSKSEIGFNITATGDGRMTYKRVHAQGSKGQQIQYFGHASFEKYQQDAGKANRMSSSLQQQSQQTDVSQNSVDTDIIDGIPIETPDGNHIEVGQDISGMFTDAEWSKMISDFRQMYPQDTQGVHDNEIKSLLMDTSDNQNVEILNDLSRRLDRGEKMQTIDIEGKPIDVC